MSAPPTREAHAVADASRAAAVAFRAALDAMARPGRLRRLAWPAPPGVSPAAAGLLVVLADPTTPVWLAPGLRGGAAEDWLRFETNAPVTDDPGAAAFALGAWEALPEIAAFRAGTPDYPDRSATLIVEAGALGQGAGWRLSVPGIAGETRLAAGLPAAALGALAANAARFPLGVDVFLVAGERLAALPRSTRPEG